jgi:hypothetical protein
MSGKVSGLGGVIKVDDSSGSAQTLSNPTTNYQFSTPRGVQDVTGVDKSAHERILLLADYSVTLNGVADFDSNNEHDVFKTISSTSVTRTVELDPLGTTTGNPKLSNECILTDYQLTRAATGELTWQVPGALADGTAPAWTVN